MVWILMGSCCLHAPAQQPLRHFTWYYLNTNDAAGQNRRDWYEEPDGGWREVYPNGIQGHFTVVTRGLSLSIAQGDQHVFVQGIVVEKDDHSLVAFIPDQLAAGQWLQWKAVQGSQWSYAGEIVDAHAAPVQQQTAIAPQQADQEDTSVRQRIDQLKADIDLQKNSAANWDKSVQDMSESNANNCTMQGLGGLFCHGIGAAGIAKAKKEAAKARNQIASDQEELERLQGLEVQNRPREDATFGGNFQQVAAIVQQPNADAPIYQTPAAATSANADSTSSKPSSQVQSNSCRNMNACLRTSAKYDAGLRVMSIDVTNTCSTTVRATATVYSQNRSCTQSGTTNIAPGQTQTGMGGYTDRNWFSVQADDGINSGKTGEGCKLVVPTDCDQF
jgi:hypothetical protein